MPKVSALTHANFKEILLKYSMPKKQVEFHVLKNKFRLLILLFQFIMNEVLLPKIVEAISFVKISSS